jgi:arabinofuranan 3-O-arabinosyltransferase
MLTPTRWVCSPSLATPTEEQYGFDESFTVAKASSASLSGSAVLTDPGLIQQYAFDGQPVTITASSTDTPDPQDQPYAAFDNSLQTAWISGATESKPRLTIRWRDPIRLSAVTVLRPAAAADLLTMQITGSAGQVRSVVLGGQGPAGRDVVHFAPMVTSSLTMVFSGSEGGGPVQISNIEIPGVAQLAEQSPSAPVRLGCGTGPVIGVNGRAVATRVSGTVADITDGWPMTFTACSAVSMAAGRNIVTEPEADAFSVQAVTIARSGALAVAGPGAAARAVTTVTWTPSRRVLRVAASQPSYLIVNENVNAGWRATLHGRSLQPVRLDGWKQGWLLPAGSRGLVTLTYQPDVQYRAALFAGLGALGLILLIAAAPFRRRRVVVPMTEGEPHARPDARPAPMRPVVLSVAVLLTGLLGFWTGGYAGSALLPAMTLGFLLAIARRPRSRLARILAEPWLAAGLFAVAAVSAGVGVELFTHGIWGGPFLVTLGGIVPELACLAILARVVAAVLTPES